MVSIRLCECGNPTRWGSWCYSCAQETTGHGLASIAWNAEWESDPEPDTVDCG